MESPNVKRLLKERLKVVSQNDSAEYGFNDQSDIDDLLNELVFIVMAKKRKENEVKEALRNEISQFNPFMTAEDYYLFTHQHLISNYYFGDIHALRSMEKISLS